MQEALIYTEACDINNCFSFYIKLWICNYSHLSSNYLIIMIITEKWTYVMRSNVMFRTEKLTVSKYWETQTKHLEKCFFYSFCLLHQYCWSVFDLKMASAKMTTICAPVSLLLLWGVRKRTITKERILGEKKRHLSEFWLNAFYLYIKIMYDQRKNF